MAHEEIEIDTDDLQRRMDGAMASLKHEFASLRTGRASASIVDAIQVDAYGQMTPINQLGTVNVPEPRMVTINVWDKAMVGRSNLMNTVETTLNSQAQQAAVQLGDRVQREVLIETGLLLVTLPKAAKAKPTQITVQIS